MTETAQVTLSSKGQLAIPRRIRDAMGVGKGSQVTLVLHADGRLELVPVRTRVTDLFGLLARRGERPLSVEAIDEAIENALAQEALR
jgi:antitoxin PrlF